MVKKSKAKKRGVKTIKLSTIVDKALAAKLSQAYTPAPILTLCGQLEDAILLLENRISNAIAKINSLM